MMTRLFFLVLLISTTTVSAHSQVIQVHDLEVQVSSDCSLDVNAPTFKTPCEGEISIAVSDKHFSGGCAGTIERSYTASDECGNILTVTQFIKINDEKAPVITMEIDTLRVSSLQNVRLARPLAEEDCGGNVKWDTHDEDYDDGKERGIKRTFIATDMCGNSSSTSMIILVQD